MATTSAIQGSSASSTTTALKPKQLKTDDFIKMMLTELQNQDPLNPAKNSDLMAQMSQIGQMQNNTQMQDLLTNMGQNNSQIQDFLTGLTLQNQIGSAGNLIGKTVQGRDEDEEIEGRVTSVRVNKNKVSLELDNGKALMLDQVTSIADVP